MARDASAQPPASANQTPADVGGIRSAAGTAPQPQPEEARAEACGDLPFSHLGPYQILERIGGGGVGEVYEAYDQSLDRQVAVKVLRAELARDEMVVHRFRAAASAAANVAHPNVVRIHFISEDQGRHFFVMQRIRGESLAEQLQREPRLPLKAALAIVEQCLSGLEAAHFQGLIHRNLKPANILIDARTGRAILVDFGLVRHLDPDLNTSAAGALAGTADYAAPEQVRGGLVDGRADLYSLGVIFYQLLAGRLPFRADTPAAMAFEHVYEQPLPLAEAAPEVPPQVATIVTRLMAKDPGQRYQNCGEALAELRAFRDSQTREAGHAAGSESPDVPDPAETAERSVSDHSRGLGAKDMAPPGSRGGAEDEVELPPEISGLLSDGRWQRVRDWAATLFRRHAPEFVTELQSTTQQVDGAVGQYERRCRRLSELLAEGRRIAGELTEQLRVNQELASRAEQAASAAGDPDQRQAALTKQQACQANHASLQSQADQQAENIEELELEQCRAEATLARLRSQRDALQARLQAAIARGATRTSPARGRVRGGSLRPRWPAFA